MHANKPLKNLKREHQALAANGFWITRETTSPDFHNLFETRANRCVAFDKSGKASNGARRHANDITISPRVIALIKYSF
jgi:hypothetical protein